MKPGGRRLSETSRLSGPRSSDRAGGAIVFWLLLLMATAAFAPCVLLPEWRQLQALHIAEQAQQRRVEQMQQRVDQERRLLEAMCRDPAVLARLARRELGFHSEQERQVPVYGTIAGNNDRRTSLQSLGNVQTDVPLEAVRAEAVWPDLKYDRIFCDPRTRPIIMAMSVGVVAAAFGLFGRQQKACPVDRDA